MTRGKLRGTERPIFINREISWLEFNGRVLEEAVDGSNPLLERLKFAAIVASNLDEFFMVRVAALMQAVDDGDEEPDPAGLTPQRQLGEISSRAHAMVDELYTILMDGILPGLAGRGLCVVPLQGLDAPQRAGLAGTFRNDVLPALTPLAIDSSRPFPMLANLSLNLAVLLESDRDDEPPRLAVVQVPGRLPRLLRVAAAETTFTWLEELIRAELATLFPGQRIVDSAAFRIARDSELALDDEGGRDFLLTVEEELRKRRRSRIVRLEVEAGVGGPLLELLSRSLRVAKELIYLIPGPLDIRALLPLSRLPSLEDLRDPPLRPIPALGESEAPDLLSFLDEHALLLHHPYDAFDPVVSLLSQAAAHPDVLAIKQTLYRTSGESPIVRALADAAERGKQVTVIVELTARFDEKSNIRWARRLEEAGAHVIYGIRGYKVHAKICLIVRRTAKGIRRTVHLGTGNYNDGTARLYTDFGLMTSSDPIGKDASAFFNALTGWSDPPPMKKLVMAPAQLRDRFLDLIRREARRAEAGQAAEIRAKLNSLVDGQIIRALYDASNAGVRIRLNIRGICCLRPGVKGYSERIEVVSIVDRFLEHSRVFHFRNGGSDEVYLSSADWMPRNLDRRIELLFPVEDTECRRKILDALSTTFADNVKARRLGADGTYRRRRPARGESAVRSQTRLHEETPRRSEGSRPASPSAFEPLTSPGASGGPGPEDREG